MDEKGVDRMRLLKTIINIIDNINTWIGKTVRYSVLLLMSVVVYEVISRRFFNAPTIWAFETILIVYGFHLMMVSGYGLLKDSIVSIDILSGKFSEKTRHIMLLITYMIFFFPFIILTIPESIDFAMKSWEIKESSWSVWAPPVYPIKTVIPIALILLLLQGISQYLKSVVFLFEGKNSNQ
ncbi:MAG: TRAP transporter small permease subunit [Clostridia bacterium]|nr:TRAP transporter small permease subunit [Clostridia bacterium]